MGRVSCHDAEVDILDRNSRTGPGFGSIPARRRRERISSTEMLRDKKLEVLDFLENSFLRVFMMGVMTCLAKAEKCSLAWSCRSAKDLAPGRKITGVREVLTNVVGRHHGLSNDDSGCCRGVTHVTLTLRSTHESDGCVDGLCGVSVRMCESMSKDMSSIGG